MLGSTENREALDAPQAEASDKPPLGAKGHTTSRSGDRDTTPGKWRQDTTRQSERALGRSGGEYGCLSLPFRPLCYRHGWSSPQAEQHQDLVMPHATQNGAIPGHPGRPPVVRPRRLCSPPGFCYPTSYGVTVSPRGSRWLLAIGIPAACGSGIGMSRLFWLYGMAFGDQSAFGRP